MMLNTDLIQKFRKEVNGNSYFALHNYRNRGGYNHWNLICSCMDWIEVAMDYISHQSPDNKETVGILKTENINTKCMLAYTYISAIDIVWASVQQLHRVIISDGKTPFKGKTGIFNDYLICKDDNEYFTHIRAVFGAHPVNLKKEGKWFASWPTDHVYPEFDYAVTLYNSEAKGSNTIFGFRFKELNQFLEMRYKYLNEIMKSLDNQYGEYKEVMSKRLIIQVDDVENQLEILKEAAYERLNSEYYSEVIEELQIIFRSPCSELRNKEVVNKYLDECRKKIGRAHV